MKAKVFVGMLFWMVTNLLIAQTTSVSQCLTQEGALKLAEQANLEAQKLNKKIFYSCARLIWSYTSTIERR